MRRITTLSALTLAALCAIPTVAGAALSDYYEVLPWYSYLIAALALACAVLLLMWLFAHRGKAKIDVIAEVLAENIAKPEVGGKKLDDSFGSDADADVARANDMADSASADTDDAGDTWVEAE